MTPLICRIDEALAGHGVDYAVAGGWAVSLHGAVRGTLDVDVVIPRRRGQYVAAAEALASIGLTSGLPIDAGAVFDQLDALMAAKNLVAWNFVNLDRPNEVVDVLVGEDRREFDIETRRVAGRDIPVIDREGLIRMKQRAGRRQDLSDVEALRRIGGLE